MKEGPGREGAVGRAAAHSRRVSNEGVLAGRVAVVTGSGRGIGRALACALARAGAQLVVSSRTQDDLEQTLQQVTDAGSTGISVVADATTQEGAGAPVRAALESYGRADVLINNVGGRVRGDHDPFSGDIDVVEHELVLNLLSAWWTTRTALPHMRTAGYGRIINIGSGAARNSGSRAGYTAAKHGLVGLTRSIAASAAPHGITVNCLCPGWTDTHDWEDVAAAAGVDPETYLSRAKEQNLQRRIIAPDELGGMAVLLASESGGRAVTGQVIGVDGGHKV